jgi:transcription antitermination factor NusG
MQTVDNLAAPDPLSSGGGMLALAEGERWFAVHSLPLRECYAESNLKNQGFRTFMPKRHKTVRHARRLTTVEAPFFPRYLFVVLHLDRDQWRKVNGTFGVARLIMGGEQPRPVPYGVVEALTASADTRGILHLDERLKIGSRVRLLAGPFAEELATLEHLDELGRVRVLVEIMGRQVSVSTVARDLHPLG